MSRRIRVLTGSKGCCLTPIVGLAVSPVAARLQRLLLPVKSCRASARSARQPNMLESPPIWVLQLVHRKSESPDWLARAERMWLEIAPTTKAEGRARLPHSSRAAARLVSGVVSGWVIANLRVISTLSKWILISCRSSPRIAALLVAIVSRPAPRTCSRYTPLATVCGWLVPR